jgi:hypothetical protein
MAPVISSRVKQAASVLERRDLRIRQVGVFERLFSSLLAPELRALRSEWNRARESGDMGILQSWIDGFYPGNEVRIEEGTRPAVLLYGEGVAAAAAREVGAEVQPEQVAEFAGEYAEALGRRWTRDSVAPVRAILRDEEDPELREELIEEELAGWPTSRVASIAEREATQAGGAFSSLAYGIAGVTLLAWRANPGACDLCQAMDGRTAAIQGAFLSPGDTVATRSEESGNMPVDRIIRHPPLHGMRGKGGVCQCTIVAV